MMLFFHSPRYHSASRLVADIDVPAFLAVIKNLIFKFITGLDTSKNVIIQGLVKIGESDLRFTSTIWKHWYRPVYVDQHFDNG